MQAGPRSQFCGSCGGENPVEAIRCVHCSDVLDPAAQTPSAPAPPLDAKTSAIVAAIGVLLVALLHASGLGFSMRLLPADASEAELASRMESLIEEEAIDEAAAVSLLVELASERRARAELDGGTLSEREANSLRARLPPEDQATVLGLGGVFALLPTMLAFLVAGVVGTALARARRSREVLLGLGAASIGQLLLWALSVEFDVGALASGRLLMTGPGPAFVGGPILLLCVSLVGATAASTGLSYAVGLGLEQAAGKSDCPHCGHVFVRTRGLLQCPACTRPVASPAAAPVPSGPGGMTRAQTGASELLCVQCVKTYAADVCPVHPDEPLLDPAVEAVRFQLLDLDAQAGTQRFSRWTAGMHTDAAPSASGGVCMECARAYDASACPVHPDEPLLDPAVEAVRIEMEDADDRHRARVGTRLMFGAFGLTAALTVGLANVLPLEGSLLVSVFAGSLLGLMAVARVLTPALSPPRFTAWTGTEATSREALAHDAKRELLEPVRRAFAQIGRRLAGFVVASLLAGGVGAASFFALSRPVGLGILCGAVLGALGFGGYVWAVDTRRELGEAARTVASGWRDPYA